MFAAIDFGIRSPGLLGIATGLLDDVSAVEPALQVSAAEFALGVFLVAGTLARLLDLHFVMGKLGRSSRGFGGQGLSSSLRQQRRRIYKIILLEGVGCIASIEFPLRRGLLRSHAAAYNIGDKIILAFYGAARHAPQHGDLSHMGEGVGHRPLKKLFWRNMQWLR